MDSRKLALRCRELADNKKAENLVVLDVRPISSVTDYYVLATATSDPHVRSVVDEVGTKLRTEEGLRPNAMDGGTQTGWVVLDYVDVMVHVMRADVREKYDLEGLWADAKRLPKPRSRKAADPLSRLDSPSSAPESS